MSLSLRSLSDQDILSRTRELTRRERSVTLQVLLHLNEVERRKLHLSQGYSSLFDYCTSELGYSAPAAVRRIQTARCVARFPEVYALLETNEVNVSTISQVSRLLKPDNKDVLLARIRGRSHREVKAIAAEYQPCVMPLDVIQPIVVRVPAPPLALAAPSDACEESDYIRCGCAAETPAVRPACSGDGGGAATTETRRVFKFTATEGFEKKFEKISSLAWHRLGPNPTFEQVFELAMDCFLEKEDPEARQERRETRRKQTGERVRGTEPSSATTAVPQVKAESSRKLRYVAAAVRDTIFTRDKGRCTFVGPDGRRCAATRALQVDHVIPVARGGASTADNLRLLCAYHNRLEAERLMGVSVKICGKERESAPLLQ